MAWLVREILWLGSVVEKIERKHGVRIDEVEQVLASGPTVRRIERGRVTGEDLYVALGRTAPGRHLAVFFVRKRGGRALIVTAREMDRKERKLYGRK